MATNKFQQTDPAIHAPFIRSVTVTPSDTEDLAEISRGIFATKGASSHSTIVVLLADDTTSATFDLARGEYLPLRVKRVYATGTDATNIVALY